MDKLELDARVAHLERKVAILGTIFALAAAAAILGVVMMTMRSQPRLMPPQVAPAQTTVSVATHGTMDHSDGGVPFLAQRLRESWELNRKGLINIQEFQAKKEQLLAKSLRSGDLTSDIEKISELHRENILSSTEHSALKTKILEIGN